MAIPFPSPPPLTALLALTAVLAAGLPARAAGCRLDIQGVVAGPPPDIVASPRSHLDLRAYDAGLADAPPEVTTLGSLRLPAGNRHFPMPFRLRIANGKPFPQTIGLSASIRRGDRLLFVNDTATQVTPGQPVRIEVRSVVE